MDDVMRTESLTAQMGDFTTQSTQKILNIFFIVDISGSMRFEGRIEAVNEAFTRMIPALRQIQLDSISEFELRIAIMTFDQYARWIVAPTPIMEYNHEPIACSQWVTYFSEAFKTLGEVMTSKAYMAHSGKIAEPYIMFMTDGYPTEDDIYQPALDELKQNGWFRNSRRFAVLIGADAIHSSVARDAVAGFVSDVNEGIIDAADAEAIAASVQAKTIHEVANMTKHAVDVSSISGASGSSSGGFSGFEGGSSSGFDSGSGDFGDDAFDFSGFDDFDDSSFI
ncbi:MAG: hypothetical protein II627_02915 [Lachnospiraceae bacterium]|nr:hypothetical protein [Lachnospiraceae bacterium]